MCLVVDYSEKLVKSDYFGVIIYNWWRKARKIGIFAIQNAYFTESSYEQPNIRDFRSKTYSGAFLQAEYTENSGYSMRFFRKIGKFVIIGILIGIKPNKLGRKFRKIGFFSKTINILKSFALQLVAQVTIVENTENSQNSRLYTIQQNW